MPFLRNRWLLYEVDLVCRTYGCGPPTAYLGFNRRFSGAICHEVDAAIAQFGEWVRGRMKAQRRSGRHGTKPMYETMAAALGVTEAERRGGMSGSELKDASSRYLQLVIEARAQGLPPPDPGDIFG